MIWLIAKKDFLLNLLSVRFIIGFVLCLFIIPFTIIVSVDGYLNQVKVYKIDQANAEEQLTKKVYSMVRPNVVQKPEVLSIFSSGINNNIGNKVRVNFGEYPLFPRGHVNTRDNPLLNAFFSIDFSAVIAIVISLLALVFSYDAITREREDGTMKLTFTGEVGRITFLMGKLMGLLLTLLPILLFCYTLACLIVLLNPQISLTASDWGGVILLFLTSIIYMLVFILLGMFISSLTTYSSSAIIMSLLCWISFVFLVPNIATYLSQSIIPTPLYDNVQMSMTEYDKEYSKMYQEQTVKIQRDLALDYINYWNYNDGPDGGVILTGGSKEVAELTRRLNEWGEPIRIEYADKKWALQKEYLDVLIRQQHVQQWLSWFSPSELFGQATDALCNTNVDAFLKYMDRQREYRETVIRYFKDNKIFSMYRYFTPQPEEVFPTVKELDDYNAGKGGRGYDENWDPSSYPVLNLDNLPRFAPETNTIGNALHAALGRLTALLALATILLIGTIAVFMKYDVR